MDVFTVRRAAHGLDPASTPLLNAQPMGFYSPDTLVADARRHGVTVYGPDVNLSDVKATLVPVECAEFRPGDGILRTRPQEAAGPAVRIGIEYVRNVGDDLAQRIASAGPTRRWRIWCD